MDQISMFCMVGGHAGPPCDTIGNMVIAARLWRGLRASVDPDGQWYYDPSSPCMIYVCPHCTLPGEPSSN